MKFDFSWFLRLFKKPKPLPREEWKILKGLERKCADVKGGLNRDAIFEYSSYVRKLENEGYDVAGPRYYIDNLMKRIKK